jgi:ubiquinone/menaquinone biosynthesis C-methylase UbiE
MKNFSGVDFGNKAAGFEQPMQLPKDDDERHRWQTANKSWWEATPMRYDWREGVSEPPGTKAYFEEVDRRFLTSARKYMPWRNRPFEALIPYDDLADKDVLEIGVGQGTHAQLIAPRCKSFTGVDLTSHAANATAQRLHLFGIPGKVLQMDAEEMAFPDNSFDYIWSWGVIHHSADTRRVVQEMHRVLRPGGKCTVMVYHRSWWYFHVFGFIRRAFQRQFRHGTLHQVSQNSNDGAIARLYTARDWRNLVGPFFDVESIRIYGLKAEVLPLPHGRLKSSLETLIPDSVGRLFTNELRMGSFLVATMRKLQS